MLENHRAVAPDTPGIGVEFDWQALATFLPYRESTPFLRVLTGSMFGFFTAWFAYPNIEESMQETRQFFIKKFAQVNYHAFIIRYFYSDQ